MELLHLFHNNGDSQEPSNKQIPDADTGTDNDSPLDLCTNTNNMQLPLIMSMEAKSSLFHHGSSNKEPQNNGYAMKMLQICNAKFLSYQEIYIFCKVFCTRLSDLCC